MFCYEQLTILLKLPLFSLYDETVITADVHNVHNSDNVHGNATGIMDTCSKLCISFL